MKSGRPLLAGARDWAVTTNASCETCDERKMKSEAEPKSANALQSATGAIEAGAGLAFLLFPSVTVELLLGAPLEAPASLTVARAGGTALFALVIACCLARNDTQSPSG